jgi:hypothetical protein
LRPVADKPETLITCSIGAVSTSRSLQARSVTVHKQTGTKRVYNEKKKVYEDQPVFGSTQEIQNFVVVKGHIAAALQVRDEKSAATLDSDTIEANFERDFRDGRGAPEEGALLELLLRAAAEKIVPRLVPTRQAVEVMLARPNDQVDKLNELAQAGLWTRMLEQLELMPPLSGAKEAYRLYNLGVANEALAYAAEDTATAKRLLELASSLYGKALGLKADEKYFRDPQTRISESITAYAKLESQQAEYARISASASRGLAAPRPDAPAQTPPDAVRGDARSGAMTNADVIGLVEAGLDPPNLLATIDDAPSVNFDLTPEALKQLLAAKVPNEVIGAMRVRRSAPSSATRPPAGGAKPRAATRPATKPPAN